MIKLDPEQALLVACVVNGGYWRGITRCNYRATRDYGGCTLAVRGHAGPARNERFASAMPS